MNVLVLLYKIIPSPFNSRSYKMARGQQKIQSQQKAAEKAAKLKKQVKNVSSRKEIMESCRLGTLLLSRRRPPWLD